jgi:hypothetical protein
VVECLMDADYRSAHLPRKSNGRLIVHVALENGWPCHDILSRKTSATCAWACSCENSACVILYSEPWVVSGGLWGFKLLRSRLALSNTTWRKHFWMSTYRLLLVVQIFVGRRPL